MVESGNSTVNSAPADMFFSTMNGAIITERMRILANGNVGIGTSTPSAKLEVAGGDAIINGITVGRGPGNIASNTIV